MIFCCYLLEIVNWATSVRYTGLFAERLHRSRFSSIPPLQCKPLHWVWRRTTTADEASPRVEPARSRITGEAEDSTVYKTLLHRHGLARGADASPPGRSRKIGTRTPPPTPPLTPLLSDIVIEIKTSNTVKQKENITVAYTCRNMKKGEKKSNEWYEFCQYMKSFWDSLPAHPISHFPPVGKKPIWRLGRQSQIRVTHYRNKIKIKHYSFPWSLTHWNLNVRTRFSCWGEASSLHRVPTGCHFRSAGNWNDLRSSIIMWQSPLSPLTHFFVWWLISIFHAGKQWEEDKLLICRQSQLSHITVRPKQINIIQTTPSINAVIKPLQMFQKLYSWIKKQESQIRDCGNLILK